MDKEVPYLLQFHDAYRAGPHFDFRIKSPYKDTLYSFILKKPKFVNCKTNIDKKNKDRIFFIRTFNHSIDMLKEKKKVRIIPKGKYGGGKLVTVEKGKAEIIEWSNKKIIFKANGEYLNGTYELIKVFGRIYGGVYYTGSEIWLLKCLKEKEK